MNSLSLQALGTRLRALRREEPVLVIETVYGDFRLSALSRSTDANVFELLQHEAGADLAKLLKRFSGVHKAKIILALGHRSATMLESHSPVTRQDYKVAITDSELENLLSQGLWKVFNQQRAAAGLKMKATDIEVSLADADILQIKLDGHRVMNPVGFSAKVIDFYCRETLARRADLAQLLDQLPEDQVIAVQESEMAGAALAVRSEPDQPFLYISVSDTETVLYRYRDSKLAFVDLLTWGGRDISAGVAAAFGLDADGAPQLIDRYMTGHASRPVMKRIEEALSNELGILRKVIETHRLKIGAENIYIQSLSHVPKSVFDPRVVRKLVANSSVISVDEQCISEKTGFTLKLSTPEFARADWTSLLASLALALAPREHEAESKVAKRRARWLNQNYGA